MRYLCVLATGIMLASSGDVFAKETSVPTVTMCDISKDEAAFDGKQVHVRAVFSAWWEGSILEDKACPRVMYAFEASGSSYDKNADATVDAFVNEFVSHWQSEIIDYDVEFDAVFHNIDYTGGWGFEHHGVLEVTHVTGWTASPEPLDH